MNSKFKVGDIFTYSKKSQEKWKTECPGYENDFPKWAARTYKIESINEYRLIKAILVGSLPGDNAEKTTYFYDDGDSYALAGPRRNHILTTMFAFEEKTQKP